MIVTNARSVPQTCDAVLLGMPALIRCFLSRACVRICEKTIPRIVTVGSQAWIHWRKKKRRNPWETAVTRRALGDLCSHIAIPSLLFMAMVWPATNVFWRADFHPKSGVNQESQLCQNPDVSFAISCVWIATNSRLENTISRKFPYSFSKMLYEALLQCTKLCCPRRSDPKDEIQNTNVGSYQIG